MRVHVSVRSACSVSADRTQLRRMFIQPAEELQPQLAGHHGDGSRLHQHLAERHKLTCPSAAVTHTHVHTHTHTRAHTRTHTHTHAHTQVGSRDRAYLSSSDQSPHRGQLFYTFHNGYRTITPSSSLQPMTDDPQSASACVCVCVSVCVCVCV